MEVDISGIKEKVAADRQQVSDTAEQLVAAPFAKGAKVDRQDGIKLIWKDRWVHLRASGTEPVSRIISEAPTAKESRSLADAMRQTVKAKRITGH